MISEESANSSSDMSTMTSRVARSAVESGRRRVPLVVRSSLPATRRMPRCSSNETIRGNLDKYGARLKRMVDHDDVLEALSNVIDPELGLDFVELGLIYGVEIEGGTVNVTFTLTTPACPIGPQVSEQMEEFVGELPGVDEVIPTMVFTPPWSPEKMSEDAKFALGY
jgi:metal-sulfur cluster biosynthetic enzyme